MAKTSALEKAIAKLEGERAVLDLAIQKLRDQQQAATKPRIRKARDSRTLAAVATQG